MLSYGGGMQPKYTLQGKMSSTTFSNCKLDFVRQSVCSDFITVITFHLMHMHAKMVIS